MKRLTILFEATFAGMVTGSCVGLAEAVWLWLSGAATDAWLWAWAVALYGGVGGLLGLGVGLLAALVALAATERAQALAWPLALAAPILTQGVVVARYVLNRDLFAEQGLPPWVEGTVLAVAFTLSAFLIWDGLRTLKRAPHLSRELRWGPVVWLGLVLALMGLGYGLQAESSAPVPARQAVEGDARPDVLFILVDTLRADHLDHADVSTPALDALRGDGVTFANAWSAASWTRPGVATLWTSLLPSAHTADRKGNRLPDAVTTWAEVLQARGVTTGALVNNINVTAGFGFDQGFDTFVYTEPDYPFGASEAVFGLALYKVVHRVEERLTGGGGVTRYYQPADAVLGQARAWIDERGTAPWALSVHLMEPHDPYFRHVETNGRWRAVDGYSRAAHPEPDATEVDALTALYRGEVEALDRSLGPFLDGLRSEGRYDDLLIVVTADHGEEFHEHGGWWHGDTLYTEQTQVPLVIKLPGNRLAGAEVPWQVRNLDVAPTLVARLDASAPAGWQGRDLLSDADVAAIQDLQRARTGPAIPHVQDPPADLQDPAADLQDPAADIQDPAAACMAQRGHPLDRLVVMEEDFEGNVLAALRTRGLAWHQAQPGGPRGLPERALFDVQADPGEQQDLLQSGTALCSRFPDDHARDLAAALQAARAMSAASGVQAEGVEATAAEKRQLCALGYLTGPDCEGP